MNSERVGFDSHFAAPIRPENATAMRKIQGIAVSPGIAIGAAFIIENERFRIPFRRISRDQFPDELARFEEAQRRVAAEIEQRCDSITAELGPQYGAIFMAHLQMLSDPQLLQGVTQFIEKEQCSIEYAVSRTLRRFAQVFRRSTSRYMAERANDVFDLEKLLLAELLGNRREELSQLSSPIVLLSHGLTPSETANLDREHVLGFVTETGGAGGHVAIVAEALEIPAVVGTGDFLTDVSGGDTVIVDGNSGCIILEPDEATLRKYRVDVAADTEKAVELGRLLEFAAETIDGRPITLLANIEFPYEADHCLERGAQGIGLYRTEFLYLGTTAEPSEEDQFEAYRQVARSMAGFPVVIRTLDLGADKLSRTLDMHEAERNPFLGLRSIRLSLRYPEMFRRQLRAILRASATGKLRMMFPLVSTLGELDEALRTVADVKQELRSADIPFDDKMPIGIMVEVPATVLMLDRFLDKVDFVSIGTNDLVQYTLAVDRSNKEVAALYSNGDPAVLRLIQMALQTAETKGTPVSLCGQMSADPKYVPLLIGLGVQTLSVPPMAIPEIKRVCRSVTYDHCKWVAEQVMQFASAAEVRDFLNHELQRAETADHLPTATRCGDSTTNSEANAEAPAPHASEISTRTR